MSEITALAGQVLRVDVPCTYVGAREAYRRAREFLAGFGATETELANWELVLAEAANNAVKHASPAGREQPIRLEMVVLPEEVEARVLDHTPGFDLPTTFVLPPLDAESGRGLYIIHENSDRLAYHRGRAGNLMVIGRRREQPGPLPEASAETERTLELMTRELASSYESLNAIFRFSAALQSETVSSTSTRCWLDELARIAGADWYVLRLAAGDGRRLLVHAALPAGWEAAPLALDEAGGGLERTATTQRVDVWFEAGIPLAPADPLAGLAAGATGFAHPMLVAESLIGVLTVGRRGTAPFEAGQVSVLQTFADFLAIQIRNTQFQEERLQAQLLQREFELAARIQRSLLPTDHPRLGTWQTAGHCESAREVGGDFYDILRVGESGLLLAIADVMGKGLPAALFATVLRTLVHTRPDLAPRPGEFLDWLNRNLEAELGRFDMFITAQLAFIDCATRELRVAGAGHPPMLVADRTGRVESIESTGAPLGINAGLDFGESRLVLPPGARVLLYTDGLNEARNTAGSQFGLEALTAWLGDSARRGEPAERCRSGLVAALRRYEAGTAPADDQTLLLLSEEPGPGPEP
jgi:serine phosphatase RsbU (regulator of sigma subunit)/anti-sigma regulatory factor (Ser/Thr protein kinase)